MRGQQNQQDMDAVGSNKPRLTSALALSLELRLLGMHARSCSPANGESKGSESPERPDIKLPCIQKSTLTPFCQPNKIVPLPDSHGAGPLWRLKNRMANHLNARICISM